jgi:hypothetical protein
VRRRAFERCEGCIDLATCAGTKDFDWKSKLRSPCLQLFDNGIAKRSVGVDQRDKAVRAECYLTQHPEPLCHKLLQGEVHAGGVTARPVEAGDET